MFAAIFWMSTAAFTVLWAVTGDEWWGFGVGALLALRCAILAAIVASMLYPEERLRARHRHTPQTASIRLGDYVFDFGFLLVLGWITQHGDHRGMSVLLLYLASMLLWEIMTSILEYKR